MTPERWQRITKIFHSARARPAAERGAVLDEACANDPALRADVDALLAAHENAGRFGDAPIPFTESLRLEPGESIGPYRIDRLIGAGGMGEVYQAYDARLERCVAIKILPLAIVDDPDSRRRLLREARAAAALNHPHICTIHEVGEDNGRAYIVMELVDGRPLDELIPEGGLPRDDVIGYGLQIADAVGHAHEKGIVHRDLKAANIMVTAQGRVKVLDFGLARRGQGIPADTTRAHSASTLTQPGVFAGTLAYMSPEQLRGMAADARSDVWALGIVLYEMAAGGRPFKGRTDFELTSAILNNPPPPIKVIDAGVRRVIDRCLQKSPDRRYPNAADVHAHLETVPRRPSFRTLLAIAGLLVAALVVGLIVPKLDSPPPPSGPARADERFLLEPIATLQDAEWNSHISPDRQWVSYISEGDLGPRIWLKRVRGGDPKPLTTQPGRLSGHVWSPDSREIAYIVEQPAGKFLQVVPALFGGSPRLKMRINHEFELRPIAWIRDDVYVAVPPWLLRVDLRTHTVEDLTARWSLKPSSIDIRADGRRVVFSATANGRADIWTSNPDGSDTQNLTDDAFLDRNAIWAGTDAVVFASNRGGQIDLWQKSIVDGSLHQLTTGPAEEVPDAVTPDGSMMTYQELRESADLWRIDRRTQSEQALTADGQRYFWPAISKGARLLAYQRVKSMHDNEVFTLLDTEVFVTASDATQVSSAAHRVAEGFAPSLSSDGTWMAFVQWATQNRADTRLLAIDLSTDRVQRISDHFGIAGFTMQPPFDVLGPSMVWSQRRPVLYFVARPPSAVPEVRRFRATASTSEPELMFSAASGDTIRDMWLSRDESRLAYLRWANGATELRVRTLADGTDRVLMTEPSEPTAVHLKGWLRADDGLLVLNSKSNADQTLRVEVISVAADGKKSTLTTLPRAFPIGARFDPMSETVYMTTAEGDVHNLAAYSIRSRKLRNVTRNAIHGVTFSGITFLPDGTVICSRQEVKQDIWIRRLDR